MALPIVGPDFWRQLEAMRKVRTFSDSTLACKGRSFKVHKLILSAHSDYFQRVLSGDWKESKTNEMAFDDDEYDSDAFARMIKFMYTAEYDCRDPAADGKSEADKEMLKGLSSVRTYKLADYFGVKDLKDKAKWSFLFWIERNWAEDYCLHVILDIFQTIPSGDKALRRAAASVLAYNLQDIFTDDKWRNALQENNELCYMVLAKAAIPGDWIAVSD